jgi:NAD(P)-dependent dehydrogenase (short-subunit alcohol dehydrogenase family)
MDLKLTNKLALATGSTTGIGYAITESQAREGARVIVNGRTQAAEPAPSGTPPWPALLAGTANGRTRPRNGMTAR